MVNAVVLSKSAPRHYKLKVERKFAHRPVFCLSMYFIFTGQANRCRS